MSEEKESRPTKEKWAESLNPHRTDIEYISTPRKRPPLTKAIMKTMGFAEDLFEAVKSKVPRCVDVPVMKRFNKYLDNASSGEIIKAKCFVIVSGKEKVGKSSFLSVLGKYSKINPIYTVKSSYYLSIVDLRQNIQSKHSYDGNVSYADKCVLTDVLFLDDLGKEPKGGYFPEQFSYILRKRYADNKPTFICTELDMEMIKVFYKDLPTLIDILQKFTFVDFEKGEKK